MLVVLRAIILSIRRGFFVYFRTVRFSFLSIFIFILALEPCAQTLGGLSNYNFLKLSTAPQITALGGENCSQWSNDPGLLFQNPALLRTSMSQQLQTGFLYFPGGLQTYQLAGVYALPDRETTLGVGLHYLNYGSLETTDASGLIMGNFTPKDYMMQLSASRTYGTRWHYGISIQYIQSAYGMYHSSALAMDFGISYSDSANGWQMGLVAKHMGTQLENYGGSNNAELPFDLRWGISKKLEKAPWQFSLTLDRLHQWNLRYNDSVLVTTSVGQTKKGVLDGLFRHAVLGAQFMIGEKIELSGGYNYLRRQELSEPGGGNGLSGFSLGVGLVFRRLQFRYARTNYQAAQVMHHIGLTLK